MLDISLCHRKAKGNTKPHHTGCEYLILKYTCELVWQNNPVAVFCDFKVFMALVISFHSSKYFHCLNEHSKKGWELGITCTIHSKSIFISSHWLNHVLLTKAF